MKNANEQIMVSALIEDAEALENLPEIFIGQPEHPEAVKARNKAAEQIRASGKTFGPDLMEQLRITDALAQVGKEFINRK